MAARLATEKGVEVIIEAMPRLLEAFPRLKVLFAGQYKDVMGEEAYFRRLMPLIERLGPEHWEFLDVLNQEQMPAFFAACDVLIVPSLNSTESFGLVQVEAMLCGTPSIASNLPGVRQPPLMTGMGEVTAIGDPADWRKQSSASSSTRTSTRGRAASSRTRSAWIGPCPAMRRCLETWSQSKCRVRARLRRARSDAGRAKPPAGGPWGKRRLFVAAPEGLASLPGLVAGG